MIYLFINEFVDFNHLTPLIIYLKKRGIEFKLVFIFRNLKKKSKIYFYKDKKNILRHPYLKKVDIIRLSPKALPLYLRCIKGLIIGISPTIYRLCSIYKNPKCKYVAISYFNEKANEILDIIDLLFVNGPIDATNLQPSGDKIKLGIPYWDLYGGRNEYLFDYLCKVNINKNDNNIIVPHVTYSSDLWHRLAYEWLDKNQDQNLNIFFKMRRKAQKHNRWNLEFEKKLKNKDNVHFVYDVLFYTNRKLLENAKEIVFLSNQTLYVTECMKLQVKCSKTYDEPFEFHDRYKTLVDDYIDEPLNTRNLFITHRSHYSQYFYNEISKIL